MINTNEQQDLAIDTLTEGFKELTEQMKEPIRSFTEDINERLFNYITEHLSWNIREHILSMVKDNLLALLSGDMESLKRMAVISEYNWRKINDVRKKIWECCASDIEKCLIKTYQEKIKQLEDDIEYYRRIRND